MLAEKQPESTPKRGRGRPRTVNIDSPCADPLNGCLDPDIREFLRAMLTPVTPTSASDGGCAAPAAVPENVRKQFVTARRLTDLEQYAANQQLFAESARAHAEQEPDTMRTRSVVTETFSDFNTMAYLAETAVNEIATAAVSTAFCLCACPGALEGCLGRCVRVAIWWQAAKAQQQFCAPPPTRVPSRRKGSQHGPGALIVGKETSTIFNTRRRAAECRVCSGRRHGQQSFARKGPRAETNVVSVERAKRSRSRFRCLLRCNWHVHWFGRQFLAGVVHMLYHCSQHSLWHRQPYC